MIKSIDVQPPVGIRVHLRPGITVPDAREKDDTTWYPGITASQTEITAIQIEFSPRGEVILYESAKKWHVVQRSQIQSVTLPEWWRTTTKLKRRDGSWGDYLTKKLSREDIMWIHNDQSPKARRLAEVLWHLDWRCCG